LLDNLATALSEQETKIDRHPLFIHSPNDETINIVAHILHESISVLPAPHRPSLMVISETGWKDLEPDTNSRPADCIIVHQNEPLSVSQQEIVTQMARSTCVIVCTTDWGDIGTAMETGLLRPIDRKPIIATKFADPKVKEWVLSDDILTNNMAIRLAHDGWFIDSLVAGVLEATDRTSGAVDKLPVVFVHAVDDNQTLDLLDEIRAKLPPKLHTRVAAIEKVTNLNEMDRYVLKQWGQSGNIGVDIMIAPTIPPHHRAPGNLKIIFLQPCNHPAVLESILVRALQPNSSPVANPITVRELTPPNPEKRKFITVPIILGWYSAPIPEPVREPEIKPEPQTSKPKRRQLPLILTNGINLRELPDEEFNRMADGLTGTQRASLEAFRKETPTTTIARDLKVGVPAVYSAIHAALSRLNKTIRERSYTKPPVSLVTPEGIDLRHMQPDELERHMEKLTPGQQEVMALEEKTQAPRARKPFLFEGQSLIAIQEEKRQEIYRSAHLTPREILAIESYIYAVQNGLEALKHVTQSLNAPTTNAVGMMLISIRKKLADPEKYKPKRRGRKPTHPREAAPQQITISAQACLLSQITGGDAPTPKISKKTIHTWAVQQMLPKEIFRYDKPNLVRWNQYITLMRTLIQLSKKQYPDLVTTVTQLIRENTPIPSFATIVQRIEALLPELLVRAYINRFPEQPMTKHHVDDALEHQNLAQGNSTKPLLTILKVLDESVENAQLFGNHSPFSAYTMPLSGICVHLKIISNALFSMAASTSFGRPCREAIRTRIKLSRATHPVAKFLQPILLQDNQQEALEQALHEKFDWATIYLDITPLGLGQPETKRQRELSELITTKISQ
jgi:hypothetical protein